MNTPVLPSANASRNTDEIVAVAVALMDDRNIGPFDTIDDALISTLEPKLGEGFGRPIVERRAGR